MSAFVRCAGLICTVCVAITLLASCARDPVVSGANAVAAGNWRVEREVDHITGAPISSAMLTTRTVAHATIAFPPPAQMQLACFKGQPAAVFIFQFKVGSTRNSEFGYRFDDKPGHQSRARFVDDYTRVIIEDSAEVAQFINEMMTSRTLYVLIRSLNAGRTSAEFQLDGAPAAISAALAGCPVNQPSPTGGAPPRRPQG